MVTNDKQPIPTVAIIGGGFAGAATVINLCKKQKRPLKILFFNESFPLAKGIAYSSKNDYHVLNVAAGKMSLFNNEPLHFVNWIKSHAKQYATDDLASRFLPRFVFGNYMAHVFNEVLAISNTCNVLRVEERICDVTVDEDGYKIKTKSGNNFMASKVLYAPGNFIPEVPKSVDQTLTTAKRYFSNPWTEEATDKLNDKEDVLILGTGLTMVDTVLSLLEKNFKGNIIAASTHGFFPLPHRKYEPYSDILIELKRPYSINQIFDAFRKHVKEARKRNMFGASVVDALRPFTQDIWLQLDLTEKRRFINHVRHTWGLARHRLPVEVYERIAPLLESGKLKILAGRIKESKITDGEVEVVISERKTQIPVFMKVQRIINCTGPQTDITRIEDELMKNLLQKNIIEPDELKLGIRATAYGNVITSNKISTSFFTIGGMLRGVLWESTAVPEIRVQAERAAQMLMS